MISRVLRMCKEVINTDVETLELEGIDCDKHGVVCSECPFWVENRVDRKECYEDGSMTKAHEVAKKYIENNENNKKESDNMNSKRMKIIDIFNNWDNFKVGTEFYDEDADAEYLIFSKNEYGDVKFEGEVGVLRLDYELIVREPVEYVDFDDIEVGEEFMMKKGSFILKSTFVKINIFGEVKVLEKDDDGDIHVYEQFPKLDGFKFIRK